MDFHVSRPSKSPCGPREAGVESRDPGGRGRQVGPGLPPPNYSSKAPCGRGGDPSSALLEVLDPEQNANFRDLYLVRLGARRYAVVPRMCPSTFRRCSSFAPPTSRTRSPGHCSTETRLQGPKGRFRSGMEIIRLAGYVYEEKLAIANQYLIPQTIEACPHSRLEG